MLKVLITSVPLMGHLNAVLSVGRILAEQGHEVIGLSVHALRDRIQHIGAFIMLSLARYFRLFGNLRCDAVLYQFVGQVAF
jgi:UDP:flavonoid glycosyltransferase YjiC (YdhE family)